MGSITIMIVLGIETSCDETATAIIEDDKDGHIRTLSERIASQIDIHTEYGGVVPEIASRRAPEEIAAYDP